MIVLLVAAGAAVGAPLRCLVDRAVQARHDSPFPWGTLVVNAGGSGVLGVLAVTTLHTPAPLMALIGHGLCGALTTYSTFGYETVRLLRGRVKMLAVLNIAASILAGLGAAVLGATIVHAVIN